MAVLLTIGFLQRFETDQFIKVGDKYDFSIYVETKMFPTYTGTMPDYNNDSTFERESFLTKSLNFLVQAKGINVDADLPIVKELSVILGKHWKCGMPNSIYRGEETPREIPCISWKKEIPSGTFQDKLFDVFYVLSKHTLFKTGRRALVNSPICNICDAKAEYKSLIESKEIFFCSKDCAATHWDEK